MFPADGPKTWLLCGCHSHEARVLNNVCKHSLIAKKEHDGAHVYVLACWTVKRLLY